MNRLQKTFISAGLLGFAASLSGCAALAGGPPLQFADRTYIAPKTWTDTTISYEAYVAPPIFFYDDQPKNLDALTQNGGPSAAGGFRFAVTPAFIIRQLTDSSSAVRTPSFNPRLAADLYRVSALRRRMIAGLPTFDWARIDAIRLTLAHHSDGQAGCFLEGQKPAKPNSFEADDCSPPPVTGTLRTNAANGDFSTTYVSVTGHVSFIAHGKGERTPFSAGFAVGYDWHLPKGSHFPGVLPDIERQLYGSWRKHIQTDVMYADQPGCSTFAGLCALRGRTRATAMYEWAPTHLGPLADRLPDRIPHFRSYWDVSHTFDVLHNVGMFVRRVDGQDYYNIGFVHRRQATLLGIVMDLSGNEFAK